MKEKDNKVLIIIIIALSTVLILLSIYTYSLNKKFSNITNPEESETKEEPDNNGSESAVERIKESLTDSIWIKQNLMLKNDCFGNAVDDSTQDFKFTVVDLNSDGNSEVVIKTTIEYGIQGYIISVYDNVLHVKNLYDNPKHPSHVDFSIAKNKKIISLYQHMNVQIIDVYEFVGTGITKKINAKNNDGIYTIDEKTTNKEEFENRYNEYIGIESYEFYNLNTDNITKYMK